MQSPHINDLAGLTYKVELKQTWFTYLQIIKVMSGPTADEKDLNSYHIEIMIVRFFIIQSHAAIFLPAIDLLASLVTCRRLAE